MLGRLMIAAVWLGCVGTWAAPVQAQTCDLAATFDPTGTTMIVPGAGIMPGWVWFSSPENGDPSLVWQVGDPGTLDGCIGGVAPGSGAATGKLEIRIDFLYCFGIDVETVAAYTAELFDPQDALVSSVTGNSPTYDLPPRDATWNRYRLVLTPGLMAGGTRDALCVDNMRAVYGPDPVLTRTWGRVKTIYR
jgi:hypothetical protein